MEGDVLAPLLVDVAGFPCLEVWRGVAPRLSAMGATVGNPMLVCVRLGFPSGGSGLPDSRHCGDCDDCDE